MKRYPEQVYSKPYNSFLSKSTTSSRSSLAMSKFLFEKPINIIWKNPSNKRNASSDNLLDLTETCMFHEESEIQTSDLKSQECQTDFPQSTNFNQKPNSELIFEVKSLRLEVEELRATVKALEKLFEEAFLKTPIEPPVVSEKENPSFKKSIRPPLPYHRQTKSNSFN
ncbi:hypothetical protein SteCoe_9119 [Stentor coeruleus]|uniref:Uncharacterized protein n=1 Tax=Stentor coeruleus TaxID=5963 RepID=A0A1R2CIG3_9CILI|nr:hypothetical protein SteCoe_9119 [Stentor coeruleus]